MHIPPPRAIGPLPGRLLVSFLAWVFAAHAALAQLTPPIRSTAYNGSSRVAFPHRAEYDATVAMTVEAWVYRNALNGFDTLVSHNWTQSYWFGIANNNRLRFYRSGGIGFFKDSTGTVPAERWTHVAASYDGTRVRFYIDGVAAGEELLSNAGINRSQQLQLGNDVNSGLALEGRLDEVRIWSVARSQAQIAANRFGEPLVADGLVARFPEGGLRNSIAGVNGTATATTPGVWGVLPRDYVATRAQTAINYNEDLSEFVTANADRIIWRYLTAPGVERDVEGYLTYRDTVGDRYLYVAVPNTPNRLDQLGTLQPLWLAAMFATNTFPGPAPTTPQPGQYRIDSRMDNVSSNVRTNILRIGTGTGWTSTATPAGGVSSWDVVGPAGCEFNCGRIFRIPSSMFGGFSGPRPFLFGEFAYAIPALFLSPYSAPSTPGASPDSPATWPLVYFGGAGPTPPRVSVSGTVRDLTAGGATPLAGRIITLRNADTGTVFATTPTLANGSFAFTTLVYPTGARLRLECSTPSPGIWRGVTPVVNPGAIPVVSADEYGGVLFAGTTSDANAGSVDFGFIQHRAPSIASLAPTAGTPHLVLRESPLKVSDATRFTVSGANFHPHCTYYLSHQNGTRPVNPSDPLPSGSNVTNFVLRVVERAADWSSVTLELDFTLGLRLYIPAESWGAGPYRLLVRDTWVGAWHSGGGGFVLGEQAYPLVHGFDFDNERDGTQFDEFSGVYRWNAYDCLTPIGPFPGANPCIGCRVPNPLYLTFHSLVFTPWVEAMTGTCLGMSTTSLLMRRGEIPTTSIQAGVRYAGGFEGILRTRDDGSTYIGPPKPQQHRFRFCDYSEPVNLWAHVHRNQAFQTTAQFLGSILSQMDGTGIIPLGGRGYCIEGNPVRAMNTIRGGSFRNHVLCFQNGGNVFESHCMVAYAAEDEVGLDEATARTRVPAPGRSVLHVYDPNEPRDTAAFFEINRTNNTFRYWWGLRRVVSDGPGGTRVTNLVDNIWSGTGVYATPVNMFLGPGSMPDAALLGRGLGLILFGSADVEAVDRDGGTFGYDASGKRVEGYPGGRVIAPFGNRPESTSRTAFLFTPSNRAPSEIRIRTRGNSDPKLPNAYRFFSGAGGRHILVNASNAPAGETDRIRITETSALLRTFRFQPQTLRSNIQFRLGLERSNTNTPLVLEWQGLQIGTDQWAEFSPLPDNSGVILQSAPNLRGAFRIQALLPALADGGTADLRTNIFGPISIPMGGRHRIDFPFPDPTKARSSIDADGDGQFEMVAVLSSAAPPGTQPVIPRLEIAEPGPSPILSWPVTPESWVLESGTLPGDQWLPVLATPTVAGDRVLLPVSAEESHRLYRLRRIQ